MSELKSISEINYDIEIHSKENNENNEFGILRVYIPLTNPIQIKKHILFLIDISSSMGQMYSDGKTKLQYIIFTLTKMLEMFIEKNIEISIHVITFNHHVNNCIPTTTVTSTNLQELINKLTSIKPIGLTNLEDALNYANNYITEYLLINPNEDITHVFLTDGNATRGSTNMEELKNLVPITEKKALLTNIFIGYGADHDVFLLNEIANNNNNYYYFIDNLEHAYLIYGEIIHNIIYKFEADITLKIQNAEIYNYKNNTWTTELYIGNLICNTEKIYQLKCNYNSTYNDINIQLYSNHKIILLKPSNTNFIYNNLTKFIFRQQTQELLFKTKEFNIKSQDKNKNKNKNNEFNRIFNNLDQYTNININTNTNKLEEELLKEELNNFLYYLDEYMKEHNLEQDRFMLMLYNDININYKLIGKKKACLYSCSRHSSQGEQTCYSLNIYPDINEDQDINEDTNQDQYQSPYITQTMLETWHSLS
jgi:uncharacterized protein YegL